MHLHILGICGTFMGSLALLAREAGYRVSGCDAGVYPPMSTQLRDQGIEVWEGYDPHYLETEPDEVIIGNALSRGNPLVEAVLDRGLAYSSGPEWLARHLLGGRWVVAVAGTHGKTSTSSMLAWILEDAGLAPGFLIGGVPGNFDVSARLGESPFFVVEADEYDTAFFDKRSKFVHYRPRTAVLNNLEFDHADIFPDLAAIETQFHHLVRTVPAAGQLVVAAGDEALTRVLERGCWTPSVRFGAGGDWQARLLEEDGSHFQVRLEGKAVAEVRWSQLGAHSVSNALAAMAAARHLGVTPEVSAAALGRFAGVKRRLEPLGQRAGLSLYDDFAHHPTAIATTLAGLRARIGKAPLVAIIEPRSNSMRLGAHAGHLAQSVAAADAVFWYRPPGLAWSLDEEMARTERPVQQSPAQEIPAQESSAQISRVLDSTEAIIDAVLPYAGSGGHLVIMSNGSFDDLHQRLLARLEQVTLTEATS